MWWDILLPTFGGSGLGILEIPMQHSLPERDTERERDLERVMTRMQ